MKASISTVLAAHAPRMSICVALFLGLAVMPPAYGQDSAHSRKSELDNAFSARQGPSMYVLTPEHKALVTGTELILDGSFETGPSPSAYGFSTLSNAWTWAYSGLMGSSDTRYTSPSSSAAHTGLWALYFDPFGPVNEHLSQTVSIPAGASATLSFWLKVGTFDATMFALDTFTVSVSDLSGSLPPSSHTYSNLDDTAHYTYVNHTFDVSAFAGKPVRVQFDTSIASSGNTIFMLDDVSLTSVSSSGGSCVEDSLTMCLVNGRYKVTSHWKNQYAGGAVATLSKAKLTDNEGAFWIADANSHEYLIRFNTATNNGKVWVAIPTFTDVEFWVSVTDTVNGQSKEYHSNPGNQTLMYDPSFFVYP